MKALERYLVLNLPTPVLALAMVAACVLLALAGFAVVRVWLGHTRVEEQHEVAGFLIAIVGVIYAVLLAFVVVIQWESFAEAQSHANTEAAAVGGLYRDAAALGPEGRVLRVRVAAYAHQVAYREWPWMAAHDSEAPGTDVLRNQMWQAVSQLQPTTPTQADFVRHAVDDVSAVTAGRRTRLADASSALPAPLWAVLIVGGVLTVGFCYFFGLENWRAQAAMLAILAGLIGMSLFVILALDYPYSGGVASKPDALIRELDEFCAYNFQHPIAMQCK